FSHQGNALAQRRPSLSETKRAKISPTKLNPCLALRTQGAAKRLPGGHDGFIVSDGQPGMPELELCAGANGDVSGCVTVSGRNGNLHFAACQPKQFAAGKRIPESLGHGVEAARSRTAREIGLFPR